MGMNRISLILLSGAALLSACATTEADEDEAPDANVAADLRDSAGRVVARADASRTDGGVRVRVEASGLAPGTYGAHVHAVGRCDPPGFESAGPHWNPTERQHGAQNPQGPHLGDLPNLSVGTDGEGSLEFTVPAAVLRGGARALLDGDGAAVVVHASADDYRTDPSGNSGARIACGVLS